MQAIYTPKGMTRARLIAAAAVLPLPFVVSAALRDVQKGTLPALLAVAPLAFVGTGLLALLVVQLHRSGLFFEVGVRRRFRAVCREKGLAALAGTGTKGRAWRYPMMGRLSGTSASFEFTVKPLVGQSHSEWEKAAPAFALAYGVPITRVRHDGNGLLVVSVGYQKIEAHDFEHDGQVPVADGDWSAELRRVNVGKNGLGRPFFLPVLGSHILIAGITGAGKGSVLWSILLRLLPAARAGVVRFWGFDPKRMELAIGRGFFGDRYAATAEAMLELLRRAHEEMQARADELGGRSRKFRPSQLHPLEVLVVDELGVLVALMGDRKQREEVEKLLSQILALGRAVGFAVIGALQDPRKETLSFRDLFPTRVAMRLPKAMVDLVLGNGMYEAGAQCDLIPATEADGAGVAFVVDEASTLPALLRAPWCSDDAIRDAAALLSDSRVPQLTAPV